MQPSMLQFWWVRASGTLLQSKRSTPPTTSTCRESCRTLATQLLRLTCQIIQGRAASHASQSKAGRC